MARVRLISNRAMQRFYVLGHPIRHSFSPVMHNASFKAIGYEGLFDKIDTPAEELPERLHQLQAEGCEGVNLTLPLKEVALPLMMHLSPEAKRFGAVNTVEFSQHGMVGHNTDALGLLDDLAEQGVVPAGKRVAVIGCGGAGRSIALACRDAGADILLYNRSRDRLDRLAEEVQAMEACDEDDDWTETLPSADIVIHCTPQGIRPDDEPVVTHEMLHSGQFVYDIVITPKSLTTPTLEVAQLAGAKAANGVGMLVCQGARAFKIWTGLEADKKAMRTAVESVLLGGQ